jgi:hypothetical protein
MAVDFRLCAVACQAVAAGAQRGMPCSSSFTFSRTCACREWSIDNELRAGLIVGSKAVVFKDHASHAAPTPRESLATRNESTDAAIPTPHRTNRPGLLYRICNKRHKRAGWR